MKEDIIGKCRKHGELDSETGIYCKDSNLPKGYRIRCKICVRENRVNQYYRNQEENIRKACEWKKANRAHANEWERNNRHKDIELTRDKEASRKKGLNLEQYYALRDLQDNKCAICNGIETRKNRAGIVARLCIDHCHSTNRIRGLLCCECNSALGKFKDNIELLESAIRYLRKAE